VIRRAFWLSVGAAAGIAGYRRATAVGRAISVRVAPLRRAPDGAQHAPGVPAGTRTAGTSEIPAAPALPALRAPSRPVRYQPYEPRPVRWSATRAAWRTSRAAWRARKLALARIRAAGLFARDVREGMDLYMNRQQGQPGPTLADTASDRGPRARPH